jgi:hypothetical protein
MKLIGSLHYKQAESDKIACQLHFSSEKEDNSDRLLNYVTEQARNVVVISTGVLFVQS